MADFINNADDPVPTVESLMAEVARLKDELARERSNFLNYQSRSAKEALRLEEQALRKYVLDLLPILDSLALANADDSVFRVFEAVNMVNTSIQQVLAVRGLVKISAIGKKFDHSVHEAVSMQKCSPELDEQPGMVVSELRPGYMWNGLVLRPAQVIVTE